MRIIARRALSQFFDGHANAKEALEAWYREVLHLSCKGPEDIKARYRSADVLPGNRVVFNIRGNRYRLVVKVNYAAGIVYIRFVGTHAEYDRIDAEKI
jgi:mRNA interferase HigB